MGARTNRLFPLGEVESKDLSKQLCLALRNAQVYGPLHAVTAASATALYEKLVQVLDRFSEIEWSISDGRVLMNGEPCDLPTAQDLLVERMQTCGIDSFSMKDTVVRGELAQLLAALAAGDEMSALRDRLEHISLNASVYARVREDESADEKPDRERGGQTATGTSASAPAARPAGSGVRSFDLDASLGDLNDASLFGDSGPDGAATSQIQAFLENQKAVRTQHEQMVAVLKKAAREPEAFNALHQQFIANGGTERGWGALVMDAGLEPGGKASEASGARGSGVYSLLRQVEELTKRCECDHVDDETMSHSLESIRSEVDALLQHTRRNASKLVERVDADRDTVAEIEQQARERGVGIQLSREELLASLAEINQELVQPLTTSTALLELLSSGRIGPVDGRQQELVQTASKSLERLECLIQYLQQISGVPRALSPDADLLRDVYDEDDPSTSGS